MKRIWKKLVDVWNNNDCFFHTYESAAITGREYCIDCWKLKPLVEETKK